MGLFKGSGKGVAAANSAGTERRTRHWQSYLFVAGLVFLPGLMILGGAASALYGMAVQWELDALERSIRVKGEPVTREELEVYLKRTGATKPAIQGYLKPLSLMAGIGDEDRIDRFYPHSIDRSVRTGAFPTDALDAACTYLEDRRYVFDALDEMHETSKNSLGGDGLDDVSFRTLRRLEEALWTRGFMALHDRDWETFFSVQEQLLDFAETFDHVIYPIPAVRHAMELLQSAIRTGEVPVAFYAHISKRYSQVDLQASLRARMLCQRVAVATALRSYYAGEVVESYFDDCVPLRTWCYRRLRHLPGYRSLSEHDVLWQTCYYTAILNDDGKSWRERYENMIARQPLDEGFDMAGDRAQPWHNRKINSIARILYPQVDDSWWERRFIGADGTLVRSSLNLGDTVELFCNPEKHVRGHWLGHPLFDMNDPTEDYIRFEFRLRSLRLAMLIDAHRQQTGTFPDSIGALDPVAVDAIGGDPYVDGPLGYRVEEGGFLVYSVGPDLKEDGGETVDSVLYDLVERFVKEMPVERQNEDMGRRGREDDGLTEVRPGPRLPHPGCCR